MNLTHGANRTSLKNKASSTRAELCLFNLIYVLPLIAMNSPEYKLHS